MAKSWRQGRTTVNCNEAQFGSQNRTNSPYRFCRPMCSRTTGWCTVKCYTHSGALLWIGDQRSDGTGVTVDANGYVYTSINPTYTASIAQYHIVEKRSPLGEMFAYVAGENLSAPEIGVGHFKSTGALHLSASTAGVYYIRRTNGDDGTSFTWLPYKAPVTLASVAVMSLTNGVSFITSATPITHIAAIGTLVAVTATSGATSQTVAAWTSDTFNGAITSGSFGSGGSTTGLEIGSGGEIYASRTVAGNSFGTWNATPILTSQTGAVGITGIAVSGANMFGMTPGSVAIAGIIIKANGGTYNRIGANDAGEYAIATIGGGSGSTVSFYNAADALQWSDDWGNALGDTVSEICVTSDRVYVCGKRVFLQ